MDDKKVKNILKENGKNKFNPPRKQSIVKNLISNASTKDKFSKAEWKKIFGQRIAEEVTVIRDGVKKQIYGKHIVKGDLITLNANDSVPADIRLICSSNDVTVDNRIITGKKCESREHRVTEFTNDCLLSTNMIFACTKILSGQCIGVVLRTGEDTVFGTLKNYATKVKVQRSNRRNSVE